jgi:hypothetical protein
MNKISIFSPSALRNAEHYQFMSETKAAVESITAATLGVTGVFPLFLELFNKENVVIKVESGSAFSEIIHDYDFLRDRTWRSSDLRIDSALLSPLAVEVESAKVIRRIFDVYGDIRKHPYNQESAEMSNLVEDLLKPANTTHLVNIHLDAVIAEMKKENDNFIQITKDRSTELAARSSANVKAIRLEFDPVYEEMIDVINATIILKQAKPEVEKFVNEHNDRIRAYELTITVREALNAKDKEEKK